jgi:hypothetical protein
MVAIAESDEAAAEPDVEILNALKPILDKTVTRS